jgi:hypothetical protein
VTDDRSQARREAAALLGVDIDHLSPADGLRVDMVSALRLVIDHEQATILSGGAADLGKLNVAVQSLIALLPGRQLAEPESQREDHDAAVAPLLKLFRYLHESVHTLSAENAQLKARLGEGGAFPSVPLDVPTERVAISPTEADVTPPGELGECHVGMKPGLDDPKPPVTSEGKAKVVPPAPPAPQNWDDTDSGKAWRAWVDAGGNVGRDPWANNNW